jgi:hypothetical protein
MEFTAQNANLGTSTEHYDEDNENCYIVLRQHPEQQMNLKL